MTSFAKSINTCHIAEYNWDTQIEDISRSLKQNLGVLQDATTKFIFEDSGNESDYEQFFGYEEET